MIDIKNKKDCFGCTGCVQKCPKKSISLEEDEEGFTYPKVDLALCIGCGLCEKVCPVINKKEKQSPLASFAVKNPNLDERLNSSSGGIFIMLAKHILLEHGIVFGAVYDDQFEVMHTYAESLEGVIPMMRSKYMQSRIGKTYQEAEYFLKDGRNVLYVGTPCQIAGLKLYLQKDYGNLLTVDFACHGVPSPGVWRDYLNELKSSISAQSAANGKNTVIFSLSFTPEIADVNFREKHGYGWKKYGFVVKYKSAFKAENTVLLSSRFYENPFMRGFLANVYLRPSCYECVAKCGRSQSDLTIADFWGVDSVMPKFDDDKGAGIFLVNTDKGQMIFNKLHLLSAKISLDSVKEYNGGFNENTKVHPKRKSFFLIKQQTDYNFSQTIMKVLEISLSQRIINNIKRIIKKLI